MQTAERAVVVVGGGVTGLLVATQLDAERAPVVLVEADERLGEQVRSVDLRGNRVDVSAEALHLASPAARELVDLLDLSASVVLARRGPSLVATRRGLRPLPAGVTPAGPTRLGPVLRSGLLSIPASARVALEPALARYGPRLCPDEDISVGRFVRARFGAAAAAALVDPLLGNLHAGEVDWLSLRACAPALIGPAQERRSLVSAPLSWARRTTMPSAGFASRPHGMTELVEALAALAQSRGVRIRTRHSVTAIRRGAGGGYLVDVAQPAQTLTASDVVLAVPAARARHLIQPLSPRAAQTLGYAPAASVASIMLGFPRTTLPASAALTANGLLVPSHRQRTIKAATFLSNKWPQLAHSAEFLVRLSAGRYGGLDIHPFTDDQLAQAAVGGFAALTSLRANPAYALVVRWPGAMPQQLA